MKSEVKVIGRAQAVDLLLRNASNRPVSKAKVRQFAHDMQRGKWEANNASLLIDADGKLRDGQHRMSALVLATESGNGHAGLSFPFVVVTLENEDPEKAQLTVDTGKGRSRRDAAIISGVSEELATRYAKTCEVLFAWGQHRFCINASPAPTNLDIADVRMRYPNLEKFIADNDEYMLSGMHIPGHWFALWYLLTEAGHGDRAEGFFMPLLTGEGIEGGTPQHVYDRKLRQIALMKGKDRPRSAVQASFLVRAWNAYFTDSPLRALNVSSKYRDPKIAGL